MTITAVASQASGGIANVATSLGVPYPGNITNGNLLLIGPWKWSAATAPFVAGDITKSAGTATIGTPAMNIKRENLYNGVNEESAASFSAAVTGSGSATIQMTAATGSFLGLSIDEYNSTNGAITLEAGVTNSATGNSGTPDSGNVTSAGAAQSVLHSVMTTNNGGGNNAITPDAAFTQIFEDENGVTDQPGSAIRRIVATGVTDSGSWTATSDNWVAVVASYKEPAAAGGTPILKDWRPVMMPILAR